MSVTKYTENYMENFGGFLSMLRNQRDLSAYALGNSSSVTDRGIRLYERGDRYPSLEVVVKLSQGFQMKPSEFLILYEDYLMNLIATD